jgi:tellurite resistance protein
MKRLDASSLPLVPASFFGIVLGLIGLGNPWRVASRLWGLPMLAGEMIMLTGVAVWAIVLVLYFAKWIFAREAAVAELRHPVQCCFVGFAGVATMMVSMAVGPYSSQSAELLFLAGLAFTIGFAVWQTGGLWKGGRAAEAITPVLYVPSVAGGFVAASAGNLLGYPGLGQVVFGAAFFSWIAIESVLLQRLFTELPMAPALRPTLFIQLAPPTVGGVAAVNVLGPQWSMLPAAMLGYAMLHALVLIRLTPGIVGRSFTPVYWSSAFGATAIAMLALKLSELEQSFATAIAPGLFLGANIILAVLVVGSLRLLLGGRMLGEPAGAVAAPLISAR